jgi:hypothetical protein
MSSFYSPEEMVSDNYRMLAGEDTPRGFVVVAASLLGDLCDEVLNPYDLEEKGFPDYASFCEWARDAHVSEDFPQDWIRYYWQTAAFIFDLYEVLPELNNWEVREKLALMAAGQHLVTDVEDFARGQIIQTCFAFSRWIRGRMPENHPPIGGEVPLAE